MHLRTIPIVLAAATLPHPGRASDPGPAREGAHSAVLSPDGRWFACTINRDGGPGRLMVCDTEGGRRREVVGGSDLAFAADSRSVVYATASPRGFEYTVREVESWSSKRSFRGASSVDATPDVEYLVIKGPPDVTGPGPDPRGAHEVFVYSLAEDRVSALGPASRHAIGGDGRLLALTREGPDGLASLDVLRLGEAEARRVCEVRGEVTALAWGGDHRSLMMVIARDKADGGTADLVLAVEDATARTPRVRTIVPEEHRSWPRGSYLDPAAPRAGAGAAGAAVYLVARDEAGAAPRRPRDGDVEVHRAADAVVYDSMTDTLKEGVPAARSRIFAWIPEDGRITRIADEGPAPVILLDGGRTALAPRAAGRPGTSDATPAEWEVVDPRSGARASLGAGAVAGVSPSRTGRRVAYLDGGRWWAYDAKDGSRRGLTDGPGSPLDASLATGRGGGGPIRPAEWLGGDRGLIVHDAHDAWLLSPDGPSPRRLTRGRERGRVYRLAAAGGRHGATGSPYLFRVVEARTKHSGYVRVEEDGAESVIAFGPWAFGELTKARGAERFAFRREDHDTPPNYFSADGLGGDPRPMTDLGAGGGDPPRPRRELIQYRDRTGADLQGTLIYPVDYDPVRAYPMVVSIYLILSDDHFRFRLPDPGQFDDPLTHAGRGYFVLLPDIVHRPREVGASAVDCVESAAREVLRRGLVDPARIGLMGGSLGGYEAAFVLSKSRLFAAGVAASPPADWATHFLVGRLGNVDSEAAYLRTLGMTVPFWDDPGAYVANSLLYQGHGITAPLLIGIGRRDPVVDCREGESLFNLLRHLQRPAYLLAYPRGGHGLGEDFALRVGQFFDHRLRGGPPPDWLGGEPRR